jgi:hypothetical protein
METQHREWSPSILALAAKLETTAEVAEALAVAAAEARSSHRSPRVPWIRPFLLALALATVAGVASWAWGDEGDPASPEGKVPTLIPYRGVLSQDGAPVTQPDVQMTFSLYTTPTQGQAIWGPEDQSVMVTDGNFTVNLGAVLPIPDAVFGQAALYLDIRVEGKPMSGRQRLLSVPFARASGDGVPPGAIVMFTTDCPVGWKRLDTLDGRFPRGSSSFGGTGGAAVTGPAGAHGHGLSSAGDHSHSPLCADQGWGNGGCFSGWGCGASGCERVGGISGVGGHGHTVSGLDDHHHEYTPPYLDVVMCQKQ